MGSGRRGEREGGMGMSTFNEGKLDNCLSVCVCLPDGLLSSIHPKPSILLSTSYLLIHPSIYLPPVSLSIHSSFYLLSICPSIYLSIYLLSLYPSIHLSTLCPSINPSIYSKLHPKFHTSYLSFGPPPIYPYIYSSNHSTNHTINKHTHTQPSLRTR